MFSMIWIMEIIMCGFSDLLVSNSSWSIAGWFWKLFEEFNQFQMGFFFFPMTNKPDTHEARECVLLSVRVSLDSAKL